MFLPQLLLRQSKKCMFSYTLAVLFWKVQWISVHLMQLPASQNLMCLEFLSCTFSYRTRNLEIVWRISITRDWTPSRSHQQSMGRNISLMLILKLRVTAIFCEGTVSSYLLLEKHEHVCSRHFNLPSHTQVLIVVSYPWAKSSESGSHFWKQAWAQKVTGIVAVSKRRNSKPKNKLLPRKSLDQFLGKALLFYFLQVK